MPRERQYQTTAEKQAAYRQREGRKDDALERAVWSASEAGDPLALQCRATTLETLLERLIAHFEADDEATS